MNNTPDKYIASRPEPCLKNDGRIDFHMILLVVFYGFLALTGIIPGQVLSIILLLFLPVLFYSEKYYLLFPGLIIYYSYLVLPIVNLSLFRVYSLLLIFKLITKQSILYKKDYQLFQLIPMLLYMIAAIGPQDLRKAVFGIVDIIALYFFTQKLKNDEKLLRSLIGAFTVACALCVLSGYIIGNSMVLSYKYDGYWRETERFRGTFNDPNYFSFYATFTLLSCQCYKPFNKPLRVALCLVIIVGLLATISFSGYFGAALTLVLYLFVYRKINLKTLIVFALIAAALFGLYKYGLANRDVPILGDVSYRIESYAADYSINGDESMSVGRLSLWRHKWDMYAAESPVKQVLGFNTSASYLNTLGVLGAHNDYVDMMFNYGLILTVMFYVSLVARTLYHSVQYYKYRKNLDAYIILTKVLWFYYAFTLTLQTEVKFYLFLFM